MIKFFHNKFLHFFVLIAFGFLLTSDSALAHHQTVSPTAEHTTLSSSVSAKNLPKRTTNLLRAFKRYQQATSTDKPAALKKLIAAVSSRRQAMLFMAKKNPGSFLRAALPRNILKQLPAEVTALVEQPIKIKGKLTVYHIDMPEENKSYFKYIVADSKTGKEYVLHFAQGETSLVTDDIVKVKGTVLGSELVLAKADNMSRQTALASEPTSAYLGDQTTIVILMNFTDDTSEPYTQSQIAGYQFTNDVSVNNYYQEDSFNQTSFSGDVTPWFTIPYAQSEGCDYSDYNSWANLADSAATAAGYTLSNYHHKVYVFPPTSSCSWSGMGSIGGNPSRAWIQTRSNSTTMIKVMAHELGHSFTLSHANSISCGTKAIDVYDNCTKSAYGDAYDPMGGSSKLFHSNAPHKIVIPWISLDNVQSVTESGRYSVVPLETESSSIQILKISKPDTSEYYYVGYRQPIGSDASLPSGQTSGVQMHISGTYLVDTTPGDDDFSNAALSDDSVFQDAINGITITQVSHDANAATVQVFFGSPDCARPAPTVSVSPLSQSGSAEQTLYYTVSVVNNDSAACPSTTFNISATDLPAGFTVDSSTTLTLAPGATGSADLNITSPADEPDGSYTFTATAVDSIDPDHANSTQATYDVFNDVIDPVVSITSPKNGSKVGDSVTISTSASDNVGVHKLLLFIDGDLEAVDDYAYIWGSKNATVGSHTIKVEARDDAGNSTSAEIQVRKRKSQN